VLERGLAEGARGWCLKDASLDQLLAAIREVASGGTWVQPGSRTRILRGLARDGGPAFPTRERDDLTDREIEILRYVARGFSNAEIAGVLSLAEGTVKNHVSSVLGKLGVRDRTRAALAALGRGLI
jgi:DNA-binding NarL/FixJ family response regulator